MCVYYARYSYFDFLCFYVQKIDAQAIEEFYGLTSDISKNSESGYILFYQSRDWGGAVVKRDFCVSHLLYPGTEQALKRRKAGSCRGNSTVCTQLSKEFGVPKTFVSFSFYLLRYHADYTSPLHPISKKRDTSHSCRSFPLGNTVSVVLVQSPLKPFMDFSGLWIRFSLRCQPGAVRSVRNLYFVQTLCIAGKGFSVKLVSCA